MGLKAPGEVALRLAIRPDDGLFQHLTRLLGQAAKVQLLGLDARAAVRPGEEGLDKRHGILLRHGLNALQWAAHVDPVHAAQRLGPRPPATKIRARCHCSCAQEVKRKSQFLAKVVLSGGIAIQG